MHKSLDQQSSNKADQLKEKYNFDEISLPTLKEYATSKADKEVPSLSIFPERLRISSTKAGSILSNPNLAKIQETMDSQSKEILAIKDAIKVIGNDNSTSQAKLEGAEPTEEGSAHEFRIDIGRIEEDTEVETRGGCSDEALEECGDDAV